MNFLSFFDGCSIFAAYPFGRPLKNGVWETSFLLKGARFNFRAVSLLFFELWWSPCPLAGFQRELRQVMYIYIYTVYTQLELLGQTPCFVLWSQIIEVCAMVSVLVLPKAFKVDVSLDVLAAPDEDV